jgi:phosphoadenosine phosphosulfate reductase
VGIGSICLSRGDEQIVAKIVAENLEVYHDDANFDLVGLFDSVYWCPHCRIPLLVKECPLCHSRARRCAKDLKPVFRKERELLESVADTKLPTFLFANRNYVYFNGRTLFAFTTDPGEEPRLLINKLERLDECEPSVYGEEHAERLWKLCLQANQTALDRIEGEAMEFIRREAQRFSDREKVVSFSGGKDSTVTATLVKKAIGYVPLLFGDTTIEFPDTYSYVQRFAESNGFKLFQEKPDADFLSLCRILEPPSRIMRWCCTVCKSRPINKFYSQLPGDVLSFDGIRRMESSRRSDYPRVVHVQKFSRQVAARPIVDWSSFAVWLYIFAEGLEYNPLYEYGYSRVGCMYCPSNTPFNEYLTKLNFPELYNTWIEYLIGYATESDKEDPKGYVLEGYWKSRNITKHRSFVVEPSQPCGQKDDTVYSFDSSIADELMEFLKPFGQLSIVEGTEQTGFVIGSGNPLVITGAVGDTQVSVSFGKEHVRLLKMQIEKQIEKYLNCVHCGGCAGVCLEGAISIRDGRYHIDDGRCTRCRRCVTTKYLKEGCVALNFGSAKKAIRR